MVFYVIVFLFLFYYFFNVFREVKTEEKNTMHVVYFIILYI